MAFAVLPLFVPTLSFFGCLRKVVLRDCGISCMLYLYFRSQHKETWYPRLSKTILIRLRECTGLNLRMADVFTGTFSDVATHTFYNKHTTMLHTTALNIKNSKVSRTL